MESGIADMNSSQARAGMHLPCALIIMDGFGLAPAGPENAVSLAKKPCLDHLWETCPHISIQASGEAVGLPEGQMGNSEVGHLNIGAGRVVYQELTRINRACKDGSLAHNEQIRAAMDVARKPGSVLHLMGLVSDGGVHSATSICMPLWASPRRRVLRRCTSTASWTDATCRLQAGPIS